MEYLQNKTQTHYHGIGIKWMEYRTDKTVKAPITAVSKVSQRHALFQDRYFRLQYFVTLQKQCSAVREVSQSTKRQWGMCRDRIQMRSSKYENDSSCVQL
jgi:hypothetical protein